MPLDRVSAEHFLFESYMRARPLLAGGDEVTRHPELTAKLLALLEHPERGLRCLLVAGSKGKGSTAAFAARLLAAGGQVGLFNSPHLLDVRERIRLNGRAISPECFISVVEHVAAVAAPLAARLPAGVYLSPTGLLLCSALLYFRERGVRIAVVEAGRGARYDDTRLVEHPVTAITPIMREHPAELGPGLARIAWHKAGALSAGGIGVSARQSAAVWSVLEQEAATQGASLLRVGREVGWRRRKGRLTVHTTRRVYSGLQPGLRGEHQAGNLAVALAASEQLWPGLANLPLELIQDAVQGTVWPGRCEVLQTAPLVLVDAAINAAGGRAFLSAALPMSQRPIVAVVGSLADKDYRGLFRVLGPHVDQLIITEASNLHLRYPADALNVAREYARHALRAPDLPTAVAQALALLAGEGSLWIIGTLSLVADALRFWRRDLEVLGVPQQQLHTDDI
jgi:dihydrofolate synthase / folylpolyglutamate synthase